MLVRTLVRGLGFSAFAADPTLMGMRAVMRERLGGTDREVEIGAVHIDRERGVVVFSDVSANRAKQIASRWPV